MPARALRPPPLAKVGSKPGCAQASETGGGVGGGGGRGSPFAALGAAGAGVRVPADLPALIAEAEGRAPAEAGVTTLRPASRVQATPKERGVCTRAWSRVSVGRASLCFGPETHPFFVGKVPGA